VKAEEVLISKHQEYWRIAFQLDIETTTCREKLLLLQSGHIPNGVVSPQHQVYSYNAAIILKTVSRPPLTHFSQSSAPLSPE
jgi:hypothetical protein